MVPILKKINKLSNGLPIICTQKDAVKLDLSKIKSKVFSFNMEIDFFGEEERIISLIKNKVL